MKVKKVLFDENVSDETIKEYIKNGFKPHVLSRRKIKKHDKKCYNRLRKLGLNPALDLKFGDVVDINDREKYDEVIIEGENPILTMFKLSGRPISDYIILKSRDVENMDEATQIDLSGIDLKFVKVKVVYTYQLREDAEGPIIIPTSRDFCREMVALNKAWTLAEIARIPTKHLTDMGLEPDIFANRGGWYREPGTTTSRPSCRHQFFSKIVIER